MKKFFESLSVLLFAILVVSILSVNNINAQSRIMEDIGSNPGSANNDSGSDRTLLYVAAGLAVGFVVYHAFFVKPEAEKAKDSGKETKEEKSATQKLQEFQSEMPVNFYLGIQNNQYMQNQSQIVMGLSFKL